MNIKEAILYEHSRQNAVRITGFVGNDSQRFKALIQLFFSKEYRIAQRAAMPVSHCVDKHPALVNPYLKKMIGNLHHEVPVAVKRNTVRLLQNVDIPASLIGEAADVCFAMLQSPHEPIAVKVFSMTVLANICAKEPDLRHELRCIIEDQLPYGSAGFKSRAYKVLKKIK